MIMNSCRLSPRRSRPPGRGFTLIELMIVITIILVLAAILTPAVMTVRSRARKLHCITNLRQIGFAIHAYVEDHSDTLPPCFGTGSPISNRWPFALIGYGFQGKQIFCPADPFFNARSRIDSLEDTENHSYIMNSFDDVNPAAAGGFMVGQTLCISAIPSPSQVIMTGEKKTTASDYYMSISAPNEIERTVEQKRHDDQGSNHLFVDGHVITLPDGEAVTPVNLWEVR